MDKSDIDSYWGSLAEPMGRLTLRMEGLTLWKGSMLRIEEAHATAWGLGGL